MKSKVTFQRYDSNCWMSSRIMEWTFLRPTRTRKVLLWSMFCLYIQAIIVMCVPFSRIGSQDENLGATIAQRFSRSVRGWSRWRSRSRIVQHRRYGNHEIIIIGREWSKGQCCRQIPKIGECGCCYECCWNITGHSSWPRTHYQTIVSHSFEDFYVKGDLVSKNVGYSCIGEWKEMRKLSALKYSNSYSKIPTDKSLTGRTIEKERTTNRI